MSSIQAYKAHKQEGRLVSKVNKQGALGTSSQASLHQSGCMIIVGYTNQFKVAKIEKKTA